MNKIIKEEEFENIIASDKEFSGALTEMKKENCQLKVFIDESKNIHD